MERDWTKYLRHDYQNAFLALRHLKKSTKQNDIESQDESIEEFAEITATSSNIQNIRY